MCIIVAKRAGIELPSLEILKTCFQNNPDGAGIAYGSFGGVTIEKGFMEFEELETALSKIEHIKNLNMLLHFRISTAGGVSEFLTHPYPLTNDIDKMLELSGQVTTAIMHNGVIPAMYPAKGVNDTMMYIKDVMYPLAKLNRRFYDDSRCRTILETTSHSKLAIINSAGIHLIGKFQEKDGILYSNDTYSYSKKYYCYSQYDDDSRLYDWHSKPAKAAKLPIGYKNRKLVNVMAFPFKEGELIDINGVTVKGCKKLYVDKADKFYFYNVSTGALQDIETVPFYFFGGDVPEFNSSEALPLPAV